MTLAYSITQDRLMHCMTDNCNRPQHGLLILGMLYMCLLGGQAWGCLEQCPTWDPAGCLTRSRHVLIRM